MILAALLLTACESSPTLPEVLWEAAGTGNDVLDRPTYASRVRITGAYAAHSSNFIVWCGNQLVVNVLLGTGWESTSYSGNHLLDAGCNPVVIEDSDGVAWSFLEIR